MTYYLLKNGKRVESFDTWKKAYEVCLPLYENALENEYFAIETVED